MSDKLSIFGHSFQIKIIAALMSDKMYLQQIADIIEPAFFESEANNWIVDTILEYYKEYKVPPTLDVFKTKALEITRDVMKMAIVDSLREVMKYMDADDLDYIKNETLKFCKNQCIKRAILDSVDALKKGDYDVIKTKIDAALKAGEPVSTGYDYLLNVKQRYNEISRNCIATPWPVINDIAGGGFAKGELVILVAGPGGGKCVGPSTSIDIEYEELGIELISSVGTKFTFWINPYDTYNIDSNELLGWQVIKFLKDTTPDGG